MFNIGDLVWFVEQDGHVARLGLGEVVKATTTQHCTLYEIRWMDHEGDAHREDHIAASMAPGDGDPPLALLAEVAKRITLEQRSMSVEQTAREAIRRSCCRAGVDVYLRDEFRLDGPDLPVLLAAGLAAHFPGDRMAVLTDLGEHIAQQEL